MNTSLPRCLTLAFAFVLSYAGQTLFAEQAGSDLTITLRAYNNASVPDKILIDAETEVTRVFAKIGVRAVWVDSSSLRDEKPYDGIIGIIILSSSLRGCRACSKTAMGSTPRGEDGNPGHMTYVFYNRVENFTAALKLKSPASADIGQILAFAIAHELGHLLLPFDAHSPRGIMRSLWDLEDFKRIATGDMLFTPQQAQTIRSEVLRRSGVVFGSR